MNSIILYTDGAHSSKTNRGGWAVVNERGPELIIAGAQECTTNNRMELRAVQKALEHITTYEGLTSATIYTDSAYVANCFADKWYKTWLNNGWKTASRAPVKNKDLWEQILELFFKLQQSIEIQILKVTGHSDNEVNILADKYAVAAREGKL